MDLREFNAADVEAVEEVVRTCAPIPSWISRLVEGRPFVSRRELLDLAERAAGDWSDEEVDAALAHHPRIGEVVRGSGAEADASRREQGGLGEESEARRRWVEANLEYEERFDRIFLIRAAGRTPEEMMRALRQRLGNSPEREAEVRRGQLAEIAVLRLADAVTD